MSSKIILGVGFFILFLVANNNGHSVIAFSFFVFSSYNFILFLIQLFSYRTTTTVLDQTERVWAEEKISRSQRRRKRKRSILSNSDSYEFSLMKGNPIKKDSPEPKDKPYRDPETSDDKVYDDMDGNDRYTSV